MTYQQVNLSDGTLVGSPGPVPDRLVGLSDSQLSDLSAFSDPPPPGFDGRGFWPVILSPPSGFDPKSQVLTDPASYSADAQAKVVRGTQGSRPMTADELAATNPVPDGPTLGDWRVGLTLWRRLDDVTAKVQALVSSTDPKEVIVGQVALQRLEYSNNVFRDQLLLVKDVFGFTEADVDESLFRAHQVTLGDLSGVWPLP